MGWGPGRKPAPISRAPGEGTGVEFWLGERLFPARGISLPKRDDSKSRPPSDVIPTTGGISASQPRRFEVSSTLWCHAEARSISFSFPAKPPATVPPPPHACHFDRRGEIWGCPTTGERCPHPKLMTTSNQRGLRRGGLSTSVEMTPERGGGEGTGQARG
jgi:hypothetical protein